MRHWRRQLKNGEVEFFFDSGETKMSGSVVPGAHADELQRLFEKATGCTLPPPEIRAPRGKAPA